MFKIISRITTDKIQYCVWVRNFILFVPQNAPFDDMELDLIRGESKMTLK